MWKEQQGRTRKSNKLPKHVDDNYQYGLISFFSYNVETTKLDFKSRFGTYFFNYFLKEFVVIQLSNN